MTINDEVYYDTPAWSPDRRYLAMQRYDQVGGDVQASIWIIEVETGEMLQLAPAGRAPTWLP